MHYDVWYTLDYFFEWSDDDFLESKHVDVAIILCNELLCLNETCILYELDKHVWMTTVKETQEILFM